MTDDEIKELLIRMDERGKRMEEKQDSFHDRMNDHGKRIKSLELYRNYVSGAGAVILAGLAAMKLRLSVKGG